MKQTPAPKTSTAMVLEPKAEPVQIDDLIDLNEDVIISDNNNNTTSKPANENLHKMDIDTHTEKESKNEREPDEDLSEGLLEQLAQDDGQFVVDVS